MTATELAFRDALGSLAGGINVVSCRVAGEDHAMTATAVVSVSLEPPLVLCCVSRTSRFWEAISAVDRWSVSILAAAATPHARWLATSGRPLAGQLDRVPHHRGENGCALIDESLAWLECTTESQAQAGDHDIVIGRVDAARLGPGTEPLVYWRSNYTSLVSESSNSSGGQ